MAYLCGILSLAASAAYWAGAYFPFGTGGHLRILAFFGPHAALKISLLMAGASALGIIAGLIGSKNWLLAGAWALASLALGPSFKA
ncbi:MAG: hypothetical protein ACRD2G_01460 [Terriglobia bacterium]